MHRLSRLSLWLLLLSLASVLPRHAAWAAQRNVLLIIADDLGVDAASFYPPTADRRLTSPPAPPMPNLKALAAKGIIFRSAWAQPWCSPSRAAIFTGRYPFRTGLGSPIPKLHNPHPVLSPDEFGLPKAFEAGKPGRYVLAHVGKWHLSRGVDDPNLYGWPYFAGPLPDLAALPNYGVYFGKLYGPWPKTVNGVTRDATTYATTDQVNEALGAIRRAQAQARPYFVWLALSAPHEPYQKPPNNLHSMDSLPATGAPIRSYYAAMIQAVDTEIGRLLKEVDLRTTTVIFLGDNGTPAEVTAAPYDRKHAKGTPYQGGIRVPLLVAGADVVAPGRVVERIVSEVDLYPTILRLAGIDPKAVVPTGTRIDGVSILPYLENQTGTPLHKYVYAEEFPVSYDQDYERTIGNCCYKLIARADGSRDFYDLKADPYETKNLLLGTLTATQKSNLDTLSAQMAALLATR